MALPRKNKQSCRVMIVSSVPAISIKLADMISSSDTDIIYADTASDAKRMLISDSCDIVIINTPLSDEFGKSFAVDLADRLDIGVMLLAKSEIYEQLSSEVEEFGVLVVPKPTSKQSVYLAYRLLRAARAKIVKLQKKAETLETKMDDIKIVTRAKLILVTKLRMSEEDAHRYIEKQAMDTCTKRRAVAEQIIKTYED